MNNKVQNEIQEEMPQDNIDDIQEPSSSKQVGTIRQNNNKKMNLKSPNNLQLLGDFRFIFLH